MKHPHVWVDHRGNFWFGVLIVLFLVFCMVLFATTAAAQVPRDALRYQADLIRNARVVWGYEAPIATFAAQIHQESRWRANARSPFAGGLAQFTPATAQWISGAYPAELGENQPFNPVWALRALVQYDKHLWDRVTGKDQCERMAFTLSAYNGGAGWVTRDKTLATKKGLDKERWFGQVETVNAGRAPQFWEENRGYPRVILLRHQALYESWGFAIDCKGRP